MNECDEGMDEMKKKKKKRDFDDDDDEEIKPFWGCEGEWLGVCLIFPCVICLSVSVYQRQ
jgi:hypothetical protein